MDDPADDGSKVLQLEIDRLSAELGVRSMPVGMRTDDGLNIFVADAGSYHYAFYERGQLRVEEVGSLDDVLYWYCKGIVRRQASREVEANARNASSGRYA